MSDTRTPKSRLWSPALELAKPRIAAMVAMVAVLVLGVLYTAINHNDGGAAAPAPASTGEAPFDAPPTEAPPSAAASPSPSREWRPRPRIVDALIPYSKERKDQMAAYSRRHYAIDSYTLEPKTIVLHLSATDSVSSVIRSFSRNDPSGGELPGECAQYLVLKDGTIDQLVPDDLMCRHTVGLNYRAIGVEVIQELDGHPASWADEQILNRQAQMKSLLALAAYLQAKHGIANTNIVGHSQANSAEGFKDLQGWVNDSQDWQDEDVEEFKRRLEAWKAKH